MIPHNSLGKFCKTGVLYSGLALLSWAALATTNQPTQNFHDHETSGSGHLQLVQLRGKVVCLPEEMHRLYQAELPSGHEHIYGFKTDGGMLYTLLRTRFSEALFADARVREKELILKGRLFPETRIFEPSIIRSIRNGVIQDLYYFCEICDIQTVAPGPCECCQGPTELVEKPLGNSH